MDSGDAPNIGRRSWSEIIVAWLIVIGLATCGDVLLWVLLPLLLIACAIPYVPLPLTLMLAGPVAFLVLRRQTRRNLQTTRVTPRWGVLCAQLPLMTLAVAGIIWDSQRDRTVTVDHIDLLQLDIAVPAISQAVEPWFGKGTIGGAQILVTEKNGGFQAKRAVLTFLEIPPDMHQTPPPMYFHDHVLDAFVRPDGSVSIRRGAETFWENPFQYLLAKPFEGLIWFIQDSDSHGLGRWGILDHPNALTCRQALQKAATLHQESAPPHYHQALITLSNGIGIPQAFEVVLQVKDSRQAVRVSFGENGSVEKMQSIDWTEPDWSEPW